jgi:hypothetical protein
MPKDWENFEEIARRVQEQLSPLARVTHNERIRGKRSIQNQCDIVIRSKIGIINFLGVIECKDHAEKVGVKIVRAFKSVLDDIGAMKGIIVSANGFTKDPYKFAGEVGIDTFILVDAKSIKWNKIPVIPICIAKIFLSSCTTINHNYETDDQIALNYDDGREAETYDYYYLDSIEGKYITLKELIEKVWDDHTKPASLINDHLSYSTEVGRFSLYQGNKPLIPVIIKLELDAKTEYHYGRLNPEDGKGFFDSQRYVLHSKESDFSDLFVRYVFMRLSRPPPMKVLATQGLQSLQNASNASD